MNHKASIRSASLTIGLLALFVIASELSSVVKAFFTLPGHHWVGKSICALLVYGLGFLLFRKSGPQHSLKDVWSLIWVTLIGGLAVAVFYAWHGL